MTTDVNKELVRSLYDQIGNKGDYGTAADLVADDITDHSPFPHQQPGIAGFKQSFGTMRTAFPDIQFIIEDLVAEGDRVVALVTLRGTHKNKFMDIHATGNVVDVMGIDIFRIKNGKIVEHWGMVEDLIMAKQIGVVPLPKKVAA